MSNSLQPAYALVPGANLEAYVHTVNSIPLLTPEQERELAESLYYEQDLSCLLYTSPSPRDRQKSRMPSSA